MKPLKLLTLSLAAACLLQACVNLAHVNSFSNTAVKTLGSYKDIGYTFTTSYYEYTLKSKAYSFKGNAERNMLTFPDPISTPGEPDLAIKADKAITFYITSIAAYFEGLAKLSDKDLVNYNFDDVSKAIKNDATLKSKLKITSDDQIDAAANIAKVFTSEIMGAYRQKKLAEIMTKYDKHLSTSIQTLQDIMVKCLIPAVYADTIIIHDKYLIVLANPAVDVSRKLDLLKEYNTAQTDLARYIQQISQYTEALEEIKQEHHQVVTSLADHKLNSGQVVDLINSYAAKVYQLYTDIKSLSNKN